jgi:outer membrane cobalamin receptor
LPGSIGGAVGANYRLTSLNSQGTLYSDGLNSPLVDGTTGQRELRDDIQNYEYGGYLQLRRSFLDDALTLSGVARVDAFKNFDAQLSPRVSAVYSFGPERRHNVRANASRAFRQPSQLDQYISLDVGSILLLGNIGDGFEGFAFTGGTVGDPVSIDPLKPEEMNSVEVGYKGLLGSLLLDVSYYRSLYTDFIGTRRFFGRETGDAPDLRELTTDPTSEFFIAPDDPAFANRTRLLQVWLNADQDVTTQGFQASVDFRVSRAFVPTANYTWSHIEEIDDLIVGFNTPEHKFNVGASGRFGAGFGYGVNLRWVDTYDYAMPFAEGTIDSHAVLDVQGSYDFPALGVTVLAGGTNLTGADNLTAYGAAPVERIVYAGLRYQP